MNNSIVAIDDEESIRRLVKLALEAEGFDCHLACDGEEGLSKIREIRPALVLCDVMMSRMDGFEVVEAIRNDNDIKHTKIVMLSARDREVGGHIKDAPLVDEYLSKPFDLKELISTVRKYVD